jgi:hypothetical protein
MPMRGGIQYYRSLGKCASGVPHLSGTGWRGSGSRGISRTDTGRAPLLIPSDPNARSSPSAAPCPEKRASRSSDPGSQHNSANVCPGAAKLRFANAPFARPSR